MRINFKSIFLTLVGFFYTRNLYQYDRHVKHHKFYEEQMSRLEDEAYQENYMFDLHKLMDRPRRPVPFGITKEDWEKTFV